mmetsp:Transcript_59579/g.146003  ORF Transcript_59579/g.146003 Transcript_59579/m.146003 type:complete len:125 (-) Transcript_59579:387-761(-)
MDKGNDATVAFEAVETMLEGTANLNLAAAEAEIRKETGITTAKSYEVFKLTMAKFISTKVIHQGAYTRQLTYLRERTKPMYLEPNEWLARINVLSLYLPYLLGDIKEVQAIFGASCGFPSLCVR